MAYNDFETALATEMQADIGQFLSEDEMREHVLYTENRDLCVRMWREGIAITPDNIKEHWQ